MANEYGQEYITGCEDPSDPESEEPTTEIFYAKEIVEELEKRVLTLTKQLQELQSQVAVEFERALCSHVIPEVFSRNKRTSSANLDHFLNMLNSGDQGLIPLSPAKYNTKAILTSAMGKSV